jgi:hypothetical protein
MFEERNEKETLSKTGKTLQLMKLYGVTLDLDGVKVSTSYGAVKKYNLDFGLKYGLIKSVRDLRGYYTMSEWLVQIGKKHPGTIEDPMQTAIDIWNDGDNLRNAPTELGVVPLINLFNNHYVDWKDLTARPGDKRIDTEIWLEKKLKVEKEEVKKKLNIQEGLDIQSNYKRNRAREIGMLFHFEDSVNHAENIAELGVITGLVIQPWNEGYVPANHLIIKPYKYEGRPEIIRTFLSICDFVNENEDVVKKLVSSHNVVSS